MIIFPNSTKLILRQSLFDLDECTKENTHENETKAAAEEDGET